MLESLQLADFSALVGETFRIELGADRTLELRLSQATSLAAATAPPAAKRQPFSLEFHGPRELCLPQRIYALEHPRMGKLEIFLVPLGPDAEGMRYEAIFT